jgi:hypothetical protein
MLDAEVDQFFAEYVYGFMWGDVERTIKARVNYGAALMLLSYTEVLGGFANGKLGNKNVAGECFRDGLALMKWNGNATYYSGFRVLLTDGATAPREAEPWEVFRCGLAHEYFAKGLARVDNNNEYEDPRQCRPDSAGFMWRPDETGALSLRFFTNAYYRDLRSASEELHAKIRTGGTEGARFEAAFRRICVRSLAQKV